MSYDFDDHDTIYSQATAPGKAGVAIVRISGPGAIEALTAIAGPPPEPRYLALRRLRDQEEVIDDALVVRFDPGASFTGEAVAELHLHGGVAVVARTLAALSRQPGLRPASAGEFTRRALDAGRLDLTQVEGLADLIDAETEAQRRVAVAISTGSLSATVEKLRASAIEALALVEASIDFADEDDAPEDVAAEVGERIGYMMRELTALVGVTKVGERIRDGFRVALVGAPNVGKSSLLNAISGKEAAIESPIAGTTRDVIEVACDIGGLPVTFVDMAGLRASDNAVEAEGVRRAFRVAEDADLRLFLSSPDVAAVDANGLFREGDLTVWTKSDLGAGIADLSVSSLSRDGLTELLDEIAERLRSRAMASVSASRSRQTIIMSKAIDDLSHVAPGEALEIASANFRAVIDRLDELIGVVGTEDVLGEIFSRFCMGK